MSNVNNASMINFNTASANLRPESVSPAANNIKNDAVQATTPDSSTTASALAQPSKQELQQAVDVLNQAAVIEQRSLSFSIDEVSGRSIIKVVDQQTEQLIRQIPSEELIKVAQGIKKLQDEMGQSLGLLIDRKV